MEVLGINFGLLFVQLTVLLVLILPVIALFDLAKKRLNRITTAIWAFTICLVPVIGPLAYWIVKPTAEAKQ